MKQDQTKLLGFYYNSFSDQIGPSIVPKSELWAVLEPAKRSRIRSEEETKALVKRLDVANNWLARRNLITIREIDAKTVEIELTTQGCDLGTFYSTKFGTAVQWLLSHRMIATALLGTATYVGKLYLQSIFVQPPQPPPAVQTVQKIDNSLI